MIALGEEVGDRVEEAPLVLFLTVLTGTL